MGNPAKLRVVQWATGGVGKAAIECVLNHPQLELAGCWVHSADKNGRDVGEILGIESLGVAATSNKDDVLALDADCVVYSPLIPNDDEVVAILRSGKNVVTPVGWVYPDLSNPAVKAIADAALEAGVTLHGSGIHPGGITERFPLTVSSLSSAVTHVRAEEFSDIRTYNAPDVVRHIMGFGGTPEEAIQGPMAGLRENGLKMSVRMIADHMGFRIEPNIRTIQDIAVATADIDYGPFPIRTGTVAARRFRWQALADGRGKSGARLEFRRPRRTLRGRDHRRPHRKPHVQGPAAGDDRRRAGEESGRRGHRQSLRQRHPRCLRRRTRHQDLSGPADLRGPPGRSSRVGHVMAVLTDISFCHLVVGVTDMDRALAFYRDALGMDVVFETLISGEPFDAVLHAKHKQEGRVVGGLLGGLMVELLSLGADPATDKPARRGITGIQNVSLSVVDLDDTHRRIRESGYPPEQDPFEIGGVRMFFVKDPDGTPVEFIELPGGVRSTYEMHRGVPLRMGPVE